LLLLFENRDGIEKEERRKRASPFVVVVESVQNQSIKKRRRKIKQR